MKANPHSAKVIGRNLSISTKHAIVISNFIRGKKLSAAKDYLKKVIKLKSAIPFTRHLHKIAHKKGKMAAGRYPVKASKEILDLLNSVEKNAQEKGLETSSLVISQILPNMASRPMRQGRQIRRKTKRSHVEIHKKKNKNQNKNKFKKKQQFLQQKKL